MRSKWKSPVRDSWFVVALVAMAMIGCGDAGDQSGQDTAAADSAAQDTMPVSTTIRGFRAPADGSRPAGTLGDASEGAMVIAGLEEWEITLTETTLPIGQVTIAAENRGTMTHALEIVSEHGGRWRSAPIAPGGVVQMSMVLSNATYRVYCPLESEAGDHSDLGMETRLVVR